MARKRKLDLGVSTYVDRHGKERARFRLKGMDFAVPHPSSPDYRKAYEDALKGIMPRKSRVKPRSIGDLFERFYASPRYTRGTDKWKAIVRQALEQFRAKGRDVPVGDVNCFHIEGELLARSQKTVDGKGGPAAAERLHEQLIRLFDFAVKRLKWIDHNPAADAEMPVKYTPVGYHSWTEAEIAQFQERHPIGSKARLALELGLWTGLRRGDLAKLTRANLVDGRIVLKAAKTGKVVDLEIMPDLVTALASMPPDGPLLATQHGKPFTEAGLGNWFRDRCNEAGLRQCSLHGLRKALGRRLAEGGSTHAEIKAVGQWAGDDEVTTYTAAANQKQLADAALRKVIEARTSSNQPRKVRRKVSKAPHKRLDLAGAGAET